MYEEVLWTWMSFQRSRGWGPVMISPAFSNARLRTVRSWRAASRSVV